MQLKKNVLIIWLLATLTASAQNQPYQGGMADGFANANLVTPLPFPISFQPYIGSTGDGQSQADVINAVFPFPNNFYVFLGGSNDGWTGNLIPGVMILPVTLFQFRGEADGNLNRLFWITESEMNASHFEIERSGDGQVFQALTWANARGTANGRSQYSLTDSLPLKGKNFYRIRMVDRDGSVKLSPIVLLDRDGTIGSLVLFPNPVRNQLHIRFADEPSGEVLWSITDVQGRRVVHQRTVNPSNVYGINISHLPSGAYWLQVKSGERMQTIQFSKQ